jgi:hypothetical protein
MIVMSVTVLSVLVLFLIYKVQRVLIWTLIALFLAVALHPVVSWVEARARWLRRWMATLLVFIVFDRATSWTSTAGTTSHIGPVAGCGHHNRRRPAVFVRSDPGWVPSRARNGQLSYRTARIRPHHRNDPPQTARHRRRSRVSSQERCK